MGVTVSDTLDGALAGLGTNVLLATTTLKVLAGSATNVLGYAIVRMRPVGSSVAETVGWPRESR